MLAIPGVAAAQDACERYRAELAQIDAGGGRDYGALARQQSIELERMRRYVQSLDCGGSRFLIFGAPTSPECQEAEARLGAMEENYQRLLVEASRSGNERRAALVAAIEQVCLPIGQPPVGFETPFDSADPFMQGPGFPDEARPIAGQAVCVRTCDGSFFPLATVPRDSRDAAQMCQAQCPAAPTALFYKPQGAAIEQAISADGQSYMNLPNALAFRRSHDETCACRAPGQSWAEALAQAEAMVGGGADIVDEARARELSQPADGATRASATPVPTGPDAAIPFFGLADGEWREIRTEAGSRRVRVVAPEVIPAPDV
ncbi:DUF2865 domain-containing protein [Salinarimonas ramus]|nr:DUF2865 domain-containing protein [Salinarimonas ramus]